MNFKVKLTLTLLLVATLMTTTLAYTNLGRRLNENGTINKNEYLEWGNIKFLFKNGKMSIVSGSISCGS
jgi:hypothetical protein